MKLNKKDVDELIRLTKKFFRDVNDKESDNLYKARRLFDYSTGDLIYDLARFIRKENKTNQQIYDCLKIMDYEITN